MSQIRLLLVDHNHDFLNGLRDWLTSNPRLEIVGAVGSAEAAIEKAKSLRPDVVLMDVTMPDINGFEATRRIKSDPDAPLVVLMTFHESETARQEAWAAGADEFIGKPDVTDGLMAMVRDLVGARRKKGQARLQPSRKQGRPRDLSG